jgi:hypothetical protein
VPSLSEDCKLQVFYHTTKKKATHFGLKLIVVADEADSALMDSFEVSFNRMAEEWLKLQTVQTLSQLEDHMLSINLNKNYTCLIVMNTKLQQHTVFNGHDPYSPLLLKDSEEARQYLLTLRHFENLYSKFRAAVDLQMTSSEHKEVFLKTKTKTHCYALSTKGEWLAMCATKNGQFFERPIEEILQEKLQVCKENLDFSFHPQLF